MQLDTTFLTFEYPSFLNPAPVLPRTASIVSHDFCNKLRSSHSHSSLRRAQIMYVLISLHGPLSRLQDSGREKEVDIGRRKWH